MPISTTHGWSEMPMNNLPTESAFLLLLLAQERRERDFEGHFYRFFFSARADGERRGGPDRIGGVASERSRRDTSLGALQTGASPRRSPSACSEICSYGAHISQERWSATSRAGPSSISTTSAVTAGTFFKKKGRHYLKKGHFVRAALGPAPHRGQN